MYEHHWSHVYDTKKTQVRREWHVASYAEVSDFLHPYLEHAAFSSSSSPSSAAVWKSGDDNGADVPSHASGVVVDVGCGGSSLGYEILTTHAGFQALLLTDISPTIIDVMRERYAKAASRVFTAVADCRDLTRLVPTGGAAVVLDKGTLDALHGDEDKAAMLAECARMLCDGGVLVTVSFPAVERLRVLRAVLPTLGLEFREKIIGAGDPARGHAVVLLVVAGHARTMQAVPACECPLTALVLARVAQSGSLYDDALDPDAPPPHALFDDGYP